MEGAGGVTVIDTRAAGVTVRIAEPVMLPEAALIVVTPTPVLAARPVFETVATDGSDDIHVAEAVRS